MVKLGDLMMVKKHYCCDACGSAIYLKQRFSGTHWSCTDNGCPRSKQWNSIVECIPELKHPKVDDDYSS